MLKIINRNYSTKIKNIKRISISYINESYIREPFSAHINYINKSNIETGKIYRAKTFDELKQVINKDFDR